MNLRKIEILILKFEEGNTSLEEEKVLKDFFSGDNVPAHLAGYKKIFGFYDRASKEEMPDPDFENKLMGIIEKDVPARKLARRALYPVLAIAASVLLILSIYFGFFNNKTAADTYSDPELAYAEARKILMTVSSNLNSGVDELSQLKEIECGMEELNNIKTFDQGLRNMRKISILDKSKDIITQKQ